MRQAEELLGVAAAESRRGEGIVRGPVRRRLGVSRIRNFPRRSGPKSNRRSPSSNASATSISIPERIDREADIPREVIDGLAELGVLGMTAPTEFGGRGFSQMGYCRVLEVIGARCSSTAIFVNAHHSIGMRALLLFGTDEQKRKWLPDLVSGRKLAAFALTEPEAGSDAANVQTIGDADRPTAAASCSTAKSDTSPTAAIADMLTVMARTPVPGSDETAVTAFLVTPDMPGFQVVEPRMEKLGIRGTATARAGVPRHVRAAREHPRAARQGTEGRAHGARLRPHDVRRVLHRRGEDLPAAGDGARPHAAAIRPPAGRVRAGAEEARPHGRLDVRAWRR